MKKSIIVFILLGVLMGGILLLYFTSNQYHSYLIVSAIKKNDLQKVERLIEKYPEAIDTFPTVLPRWMRLAMDMHATYNPLQTACDEENYEIAHFLINAGADINVQDDFVGSTPLIICFQGNTETKYHIAELLLERGADMTVRRIQNGEYDALGACVLGMVSEKEGPHREKSFLKMLQKVDQDTYDYGNLMEYIILIHDVATLKLLFENASFDVNQYECCGKSALISSVVTPNPNVEIIELLIANGAEKSFRDQNNKTAYDYAIENGLTEIAELLK